MRRGEFEAAWTTIAPTAWYPTMRLFWQQRPGEWSSVVAGLTAALARVPGVASPRTV